jgi:hypothetical protein
LTRIIVLKLSGHLINYINVVKKTIDVIKSMRDARFVLVPGGSIFADYVRDLQKTLGFDDDTAHWLAVKAMEMYAVMLINTIKDDAVAEASDLNEVNELLKEGRIPMVMPYRILRKRDVLPHSWNVTSDSIAVLIASLLNAEMVILAKPVNGITDHSGKVIRRIKAAELTRIRVDVVDPYTPTYIQKARIPLAIYNMFSPELLKHIVYGVEDEYTLILPA